MWNQDTIMADTKNALHGGYSPDMDGPSHEATYYGFVRFAEIATAVIVCWVLALAVGGVKHAWLSAVFGVILSGIAGAIGAMAPNVGVRAPAAVGILLVLMLIFY
jgi:hypothetical protein